MLCVGLVGVTGHLVEVEADLAAGLPAVVISGLPDTALHEARDRVRAAVVNSGQRWPNRRITLNLLPADLPKFGSAFDLAIAAALLGGSGELPLLPLEHVVVLGELGLDGTVRPVRGVLPMVAAAARAGVGKVIVPVGNAAEAAVVPGVRVRAVDTLHRLVSFIRDGSPLIEPEPDGPSPAGDGPDLAEVAGQGLGRRALEVAAAGGHHLALVGPPGAGKTMLAERLPSILPELDDEAALEVTALHSIAGLLPPGGRLLRRPPFQAPHHTATVPAVRPWWVPRPVAFGPYIRPVDPSTAQLAAAGIAAGSVLLGTGLSQALTLRGEARRHRLESAARWHDERRRLASFLVSETMRVERNLEDYLDDLPEDGQVREQLLELGHTRISELPNDVSLDGINDITLGMLDDLVEEIRKKLATIEEHAADLSMVASDQAMEAAERLITALWVTTQSLDMLYPREHTQKVLGILTDVRRMFQWVMRDELNGTLAGVSARRTPRQQRRLFRRQQAAPPRRAGA